MSDLNNGNSSLDKRSLDGFEDTGTVNPSVVKVVSNMGTVMGSTSNVNEAPAREHTAYIEMSGTGEEQWKDSIVQIYGVSYAGVLVGDCKSNRKVELDENKALQVKGLSKETASSKERAAEVGGQNAVVASVSGTEITPVNTPTTTPISTPAPWTTVNAKEGCKARGKASEGIEAASQNSYAILSNIAEAVEEENEESGEDTNEEQSDEDCGDPEGMQDCIQEAINMVRECGTVKIKKVLLEMWNRLHPCRENDPIMLVEMDVSAIIAGEKTQQRLKECLSVVVRMVEEYGSVKTKEMLIKQGESLRQSKS